VNAPLFRGRVDRVVAHPRARALSESALALYLALAQRATAGGHLSDGATAVACVADPLAPAWIRELVLADLLASEPGGDGLWLRAPWALDDAEVFMPLEESHA
jgi:type II secretory pathway pseudopilin PulG